MPMYNFFTSFYVLKVLFVVFQKNDICLDCIFYRLAIVPKCFSLYSIISA